MTSKLQYILWKRTWSWLKSTYWVMFVHKNCDIDCNKTCQFLCHIPQQNEYGNFFHDDILILYRMIFIRYILQQVLKTFVCFVFDTITYYQFNYVGNGHIVCCCNYQGKWMKLRWIRLISASSMRVNWY